MTEFTPRYYALYGLSPDATIYFRIRLGGYDRWDGRWVEVSKAAADVYSRAIENGDGAVQLTSEEVARLF